MYGIWSAMCTNLLFFNVDGTIDFIKVEKEDALVQREY